MSTVFNDEDIAVTSMQQDDLYLYQGQTELTEDFEIEVGQTYKVTKDGVDYEIVATEFQYSSAIIYGNLEELESGSFVITIQRQLGFGLGDGKGGTAELVVMGISSNEVSNVSLKIEAETESVHTLADKYLSDSIARVSDLPEQAFNIDEENFNIYPTFTNDSNTVDTRNSLILAAPSASNNSFEGGNNVSIVGANSSNTISGGYNIAILTSPATTVGGNNNTVISSYGGQQSMGNSEYGSIMIGGVGGISMSGGGYQKVAINAGYGTSITGSHSTVISSSAVIGAANSTVIGVASGSARTITAGDSHMIIGGDSSPKTISNGSNNSIIGSGYSSIENGSSNVIIGGTSASISGSSTFGCAMICAPGNSAIQGNAGNMIIGGATWASITIPDSVYNCIVIGGGVTNPTESDTVYLNTLNATVGVKTKKLTIAGINPADCFMYSEIIDASSDVALSRVLANTSSTKTDGYAEILYKATSGVTCSAYIDSTDVALTADGAWHKLEQGCNPAAGVEIHINNSSPVTDATLEVISKVYYIYI